MAPVPSVLDNPIAIALVTIAVFALLAYQRTLSWPEYRRLHGLKRVLVPIIDRRTNLFVISSKGTPENDDEYLRTMSMTVRETFELLVDAGGSPHLVNSIKRRPESVETRYSAAHVVWTHDDGSQTEAYLFSSSDGTQVYAHHEPGVATVDEHLEGYQTDGDPRGVVTDALNTVDETES